MHRRNLLEELTRYAHRHPDEQSSVARFNRLLEDHPNCFERDCWAGHITGSAWLLDPSQSKLLLTHHRKLNMWLQLGGHSDGDPDTAAVAKREAEEESGLPVALSATKFLILMCTPFQPARMIQGTSILTCVFSCGLNMKILWSARSR